MTEKIKKKSFFRSCPDTEVYDLLKGQCAQGSLSADLFVQFMHTLDPDTADRIEEAEKTADRKRETLIYYVENTFITPVSRHYLFNLSRVIDDLTDEIKDLKDFIQVFDYRPTPKNIEMAEINRDSIHILEESVGAWISSDDDRFWKGMIRIKKNENKVKRLFWENIREIEGEDSIRDIISSREFCRDLNSLANKTGKVADRLGDLKIKSIK